MQRWLLVLALAGSLAVFGGAYSWATVPIAAGALLVAVSAPRRTFHFPHSCRSLDLALGASLAAVALQLAPLPPTWATMLTPHAARLRGTLRLDAAILEGRAVSVSIDPRATLEALLVFASAVVIFWSARATFSAGGVRRFCRAIAFIGGVFGLEAIIQQAATPRLIYGFWPPYTPGALPFGPFFNRNHFAAWLLMAIPLVAGYLAARVRIRTGDVRETGGVLRVTAVAGTPLVMALLMMLIAMAAALSRSAILGFAAATVTAWLFARTRVDVMPKGVMAVLGLAALVLVFLVTAVDVEQWVQRLNSTFSQTSTSRITIWRESLPILRDFWVTGIGAGAYSMAMLLYQQSVIPLPHLRSFAHFNQAHSHYLQVAVEGGLLVTVPVVVAMIAFVRVARAALQSDRGEAMWIRVGAATALVGIATQSVWETPLRMPANALLCAALAGIVVHRRAKSASTPLS